MTRLRTSTFNLGPSSNKAGLSRVCRNAQTHLMAHQAAALSMTHQIFNKMTEPLDGKKSDAKSTPASNCTGLTPGVGMESEGVKRNIEQSV